MKLNDKAWLKSLNAKLEKFLLRDAWEFLPRQKMPRDRKTLSCRWIFRLKIDGSKKSRSVVRGYEQEPGVDYVESYSPLATNTTIKVALAQLLYLQKSYEDWVMDMVDVTCISNCLRA
jgi:hypothetical protein